MSDVPGVSALPPTSRGEQTRTAIIDAALRLFRERGYEKTTMRLIAAESGVSLGNAYYYYRSKDHLIQAFYDQMATDHQAAIRSGLDRVDRFEDRLRIVLEAWITVARPYHEFAGKFFKNAAEPSSPLSPFSPESAPTRAASIAIFRDVVERSDLKVPPALREELPGLLWLLQMGMVLFWVHDASPGQRRSVALAQQVAPLVAKVLRLTRVPGVRGAINDVVALIASLKNR